MFRFRTLMGIVAAMISLPAFGLAIQFDFGTVVGPYNGAIAPGYEPTAQEFNIRETPEVPILITNLGGMGLLNSQKDGTVWNAFASGGTFDNLTYVDGASAVGVTATVAGAASPTSLGGWSGGPAGNAGYGWARSDDGVQSTSLMQDELTQFGSTSEYDPILVGFRVTGLPAGTYTMFVMVATTGAEDRSRDIKAGVFTDISQNLYDDPALSFVGATGTDGVKNAQAWVAGQNYVMTTVTTTSQSDYIVVMVHGAYSAIGGIQIIQQPVPEPATMTLLALGGLALLRRKNGSH